MRKELESVNQELEATKVELEKLEAQLSRAGHADDCPVKMIPGDISLESDGRLLDCRCHIGGTWDLLVEYRLLVTVADAAREAVNQADAFSKDGDKICIVCPSEAVGGDEPIEHEPGCAIGMLAAALAALDAEVKA